MFAVVYIPQFSLQAVLRHEPELRARPVALVDPAMTTPRVVDATAAARAAGIQEGLTAPQALARSRDALIRHRSPAKENTATDAVIQCAYGFSPNLEKTSPGVVTIDLHGLAALGVERDSRKSGAIDASALRGWGGRLVDALSGIGLRARVGLGVTPNVARHAAIWADTRAEDGPRTGEGAVHVVEDSAAFVAKLPVAALGPSDDVAGLFRQWGIGTVGELLALGQAELADRLGLEALALFAAASVTATRPLNLAQPSERFEESHEFEVEVETLEPLLFILRRFVDALSQRLNAAGLAAGALELRLRLESGATTARTLKVPQPTGRAEPLFRILHTHLENLRTDSPIQGVALEACPTRPEQKQFSLFEAAIRDPHQFEETLGRLAALVGSDRVGSPRREDGHRPDAFVLAPPDFERSRDDAGDSAGPPELRRPIPMRRLRPALPAEVEMGEGAPIGLRCAVARGRLAEARGPWMASGHWWDERRWERETWEVATRDGAVLQLARDADGWKVEGILD